MNGHSDVGMGAACMNDDVVYEKLKYLRNGKFYSELFLFSFTATSYNKFPSKACGIVPSPFDCYLVNRSLKTLSIRMERHFVSALKVARFLETHERPTDIVE
jgi:cystathionine gamma-lyase